MSAPKVSHPAKLRPVRPACVLSGRVAAGWLWLLASVAGVVVAPAQTQSGRFDRPLVVPTATDNYPHSYRGESGESEGFAVELLDAVARVMDLRLQRVTGPSHNMRPGLLAGEYDIIPVYGFEPDRASYVAFSASYLELQGALFSHRDNTLVRSVDDLAGRTVISTGPGGTGDRFFRQRVPLAHVIYSGGAEDAMRRIEAREADALFITRLTGLSVVERYGMKGVVTLGGALQGYEVRLCFAVRKDDTVLLTRLNEGLAILHRTGEFDRIYRKWFGRFEPPQYSGLQVGVTLTVVFGLALLAALWGLGHQRTLRGRIAGQAKELAESRMILAEAQAFAHLGHWRRTIGVPDLVTWSEETYRIYERDPKLGPAQNLDELTACVSPADAVRWRAEIERAMREEHAYHLDLAIEPRRGLRKYIDVRGRSWRDESGRIVAVFGTVQDITARRQAELARQESEQLLRALYENLPDALGVIERDGGEWRFVSLNPMAARLAGIEGAPVPGMSAEKGDLPLARQSWWRELLDRAANAAGPVKFEFQREEQKREFAATIVPLRSREGRPRCCFLIEDATERKLKDAEIAQGRRLRAIGELVGGIAHEFNNLLTPVVFTSDLLLQQWRHETELHADHQLIAEAARRAAELTRRLLSFGRKADTAPEVVDVRATVEANLDLLRHTVDRRIRIVNTLPAGLPALWLNAGDLNQILLNLLLNARDTLEEKLALNPPAEWSPSIALGAACVDGASVAADALSSGAAARSNLWLRLTVTDNGLGMSPAVLERVFEPFYTTKPVGRGTGLGLATVWHLASELGGRIDVESKEGSGTTFCVSLPVRPPVEQAIQPVVEAVAPVPAGALRLLVAEDEESIARVLLAVLGRDGHKVTLAANGREAWELFLAQTEGFDALLFDLNMPELTGLEFARRVRERAFKGPMLVMSGRVSEDDREVLADLGVHTIVEKPFTLAVLRESLATVVAEVGIRRVS